MLALYYTELIEAGVKFTRVPAGVCPLKDVCQRWGESCGWIRQYGFQSQYLNFECGVYIYENPVVEQIKKILMRRCQKCVRMTEESVEALPGTA